MSSIWSCPLEPYAVFCAARLQNSLGSSSTFFFLDAHPLVFLGLVFMTNYVAAIKILF